MKNNVIEDDKQKIDKILEKRNFDSFVLYFSQKYSYDINDINHVIELMKNENSRNELLQKIRKVKNINKTPEISIFMDILKEQNGFIFEDEMSETMKFFTDNTNTQRFSSPKYTFQEIENEIIMKEGEEPDFEISEELRSAIFDNMPEDITEIEQKAYYIYIKLCQLLEYDSEYAYWNKIYEGEYPFGFSEEKLKNIKPGSKVICQDFSRIYNKLLNELGDEIQSYIIKRSEKERSHWLVGFYTSKVSAKLDSTDRSGDKTDDLTNVKIGRGIEGCHTISKIKNSVVRDDLYEMEAKVTGKEVKFFDGVASDCQGDYRDFDLKVEAFAEMVKNNQLSGSELVGTFIQFKNAGFFGPVIKNLSDPIKASFLLKKTVRDGRDRYERVIIFKDDGLKSNGNVYCIDTENGELSRIELEEAHKRIQNGELIYEDEKHTIDNFR